VAHAFVEPTSLPTSQGPPVVNGNSTAGAAPAAPIVENRAQLSSEAPPVVRSEPVQAGTNTAGAAATADPLVGIEPTTSVPTSTSVSGDTQTAPPVFVETGGPPAFESGTLTPAPHPLYRRTWFIGAAAAVIIAAGIGFWPKHPTDAHPATKQSSSATIPAEVKSPHETSPPSRTLPPPSGTLPTETQHPPLSPPVQIALNPGRLDFKYRAGDPPPRPREVSVSDSGGQKIKTRWQDPSSSRWLRADVRDGSIIVRVLPTGMTAGTHSATLLVTAEGNSADTASVPIVLTIETITPPIGGGAFKQLWWEGTLRPGEILKLTGATASSGEMKAAPLPAANVELKNLKSTLQLVSTPGARNGFTMQIKNIGAEPETSIIFFFREMR